MNRRIFKPSRRDYGEGADPVSAIAAAAGQLFSAVGQTAQAVGAGKQAKAGLTMQTNEYILAQQQAEAAAKNTKMLVGAGIVGVVGVITAIVVWRATGS
jgi:hypothetical protein